MWIVREREKGKEREKEGGREGQREGGGEREREICVCIYSLPYWDNYSLRGDH